MRGKLILAIDVDACIHKYSKGWVDGSLYDDVVDGFFEWALEAEKMFRLVIHSSRLKDMIGRSELEKWLVEQVTKWAVATGYKGNIPQFEFSAEKPPAWLTIDDRAICFQGDWSAPELQPETLRQFRPWTQR